MKTILTIAGHDPSSGAGITADLAVIAAHGFFGTSAITALTVQSTIGVADTYPVDATILAESLGFLVADLPPAAIKIGMLATVANVTAVASFLRQLRALGQNVPVVLDPVLRSTSGKSLLEEDGVAALKRELIPLVDWITPNIAELAILTGRALAGLKSTTEGAARELSTVHPGLHIAATGGDQDSADDLILLAGGLADWLRGPRILSLATHGSGCAFSTALACHLAAGDAPLEAGRRAKNYVARAIRTAAVLGYGRGPMNLLWPLERERDA